MSVRCPSCNHSLGDDELPRLDEGAKVLCPECQAPLTLPEMTIPLSLAEVKRQSKEHFGLDPSKRYALLVMTGPETGRVVTIEKKLITIGRSGCDVILDDPELSRRHARIRVRGDEATLDDLGSTNGTFVEDKRIQSATIENRSKFRVGTVELAFVVTDRLS